MDGLLDFSKDVDVPLLDRVVGVFYSGSSPAGERKQAEEVLKQFQEHPDAWTRADQILQHASHPQAKYLALSILERLVATRWKVLPLEQRQGIRNFIVNMCTAWSDDDAVFRAQRPLLNKANLVLVQILKQEWPANWPDFIPEIVGHSERSFNICENNMAILRLLSEEVFDYSAEQLTQAKAEQLKRQMCNEFSQIYHLCITVLDKVDRASLISATLQSLLRYLSWIPIEYIFQGQLIEMLLQKLPVPEFRNVALKCLTEISSLSEPKYDKQFFALFLQTLEAVNMIVPVSTDLKQAYESAGARDQEFIQNLALFLSSFLSSHLLLVESPDNKELLINAHMYLIKISQIDEREVFKSCLDYWARLVLDLYEEIQQIPVSDLNPALQRNLAGNFSLGGGAANPEVLANYPLRKHIYSDVLSSLRLVMIEKMVRPEEVLIVENDEGEIVREFVKESDTITLYKSMREVLVYLTHLDVVDTENIMTDKLQKQVNGSEWSWANLNALCWAIGSISGAMNEEMEKRFLVTVIKELLGLTEQQRGKDNKAVVASNIMYIVGQYPRFLKAHWRFLKTVVNKLFEFMHETHEGVQDMACDTFIKIAQKCRRHFVAQQNGETEPFIDEIVRTLDRITSDLQPQQVHTFYEACGYIISAQAVRQTRERLLAELMRLPNMAWQAMLEQSQREPELLTNPDNIKIIANIMKTNVSTCSSLGPGFYTQLGKIYLDMLAVYRAVSGMISDSVVRDGVIATKTPRVRGLRTIKKEVLKLIETYISKAESHDEIINDMAGPLLAAVLDDYRANVPDARESEVLNCMNTLVAKVGTDIPDMVLTILEHVFECTLDMINKTMYDYPEFRVEFFKLLRTIDLNCFPALLKLPEDIFSKTLDACLWAAKHDNREVESSGLSLTYELVGNMAALIDTDPQVADKFFQKFFKPIIGDTFYVLTDQDHKAGFKSQAQILAKLVSLVEGNRIGVPLYVVGSEAPPGTTNSAFFREYLTSNLLTAFPNLQRPQITVFIDNLFSLHADPFKFKNALRDFIIQIREFAGDEAAVAAGQQPLTTDSGATTSSAMGIRSNADTDYLYAEERENERAAKEKQERERALRVGGLLKPSEMEED